jgi:hypothetical protein
LGIEMGPISMPLASNWHRDGIHWVRTCLLGSGFGGGLVVL